MTALADAPTYTPDGVIWPGLDQLATCLCEELIRSGLPELCFCGVVAGTPALDLTDEDKGMAWVRLLQVYPSTTFPQPTSTPSSCTAPLVAQVEIGVMRCFPAAMDVEHLPTEQEQWDAARLQQADMMAMYRAIQCCYKKFDEFSIGAYTPLGPDGGLVGGTWQVFLTGWGQ